MNKTLKKILGVSALTAFAVAPVSAASFSDTAGHWVAEYLDTAIEAGVIDGTKSNFFPEANITRAALTKMVVNYDNGGKDPMATDYEEVAGFSDVSENAWYYHHVNYAADAGIIDGSKQTFNPAAPITRAAALKIITVALTVPSDSTKALPYSDVNTGDWYYSYVNDAFNNCIIKEDTKFYPSNPITRAGAVKIFVKSLNPGCEAPVVTPTTETTPATTETTSTTPAATPATEPVVTPNPDAVSTNTVEVTLNTSVPTSSVPISGSNIEFMAFDVTAGSAEDVKLTGVTAYHVGQGREEHISAVKLYDGFIQRGGSKSFSGDDDIAQLNLASEAIVIPAGTTKTIFVKADISTLAAASVTHGVTILDAEGIQLYGVETGGAVPVTGSFPLAGPLREVANFNVGKVTVAYNAVSDSSLEIGQQAAELANIKLDVDSEEDVFAKSLTVELQGVDDGDIANLFVEVDGVVVSDVVAMSNNDDVTFDLTVNDSRGVLIDDSSTEYFYIKGDLTPAIDNFDTGNGVAIDDLSSDFVIIGAQHGFDAAKEYTAGQSKANFSDITIEGGDLNFSFESETSDISDDKDNVKMGTLTIENLSGAAEIQNTFGLTVNVLGEGATAGDALTHVENVRLVDMATGRTVFGPNDPDTTTGFVRFNDEFIVPALTTLNLEVQMDTKREAEADEKFEIKLDMSTFTVEGGENLDEVGAVDVKPAGTITTNVKTVTLPNVTFALKSLGGDNYVKKSKDVTVWTGTARSGDVEDITVTRIGFKNTGTATTSDVNTYSLFAKSAGGEWVALEKDLSSANPNTVFTFSGLAAGGLVVKQGEEVELKLTADIASEVVNNNTIAITFDGASVQSKDTDGDFLSDVPADIASGATFTLKESGTLQVTLDASRTPDAAIALAGTEVPLAVYKFEATDEGVKVEDLEIVISGSSIENAAKSVDAVTLYYQDTGTAVLKTGGAEATTTTIDAGTGVAFIEGMDLSIEEGEDTYIELRATIDGIDDDSSQEAVSGADITVSLNLDTAATTDSLSDIKGEASGSTTYVATSPVTGANEFLVTNNKVIAKDILSSSDLNKNLADGPDNVLMKIEFDVLGDNEAYLKTISPNVSASGATVGDIALYEGGKLLASASSVDVAHENAEAQVSTVTISGTVEALDVFNVSINGNTYSASGADATAAASALATAIDADSAVSATSALGVVTITADTAGTAFTVSATSDDPFAAVSAVQQVDTITVTTLPAIANFDINAVTVTANLAGGDTVNELATKIAAAIDVDGNVTAAANNNVVTVTADTAGTPFTLTGDMTVVHTTANVVASAGTSAGEIITSATSTPNKEEVIAVDGGILTVGTCTASAYPAPCDSSTFGGDGIAGTADDRFAFRKDGNYTIKADVALDPVGDDSVTLSIAVNGSNGSDGIGWIDYGENGDETNVINWIDLGSDSTTSLSASFKD